MLQICESMKKYLTVRYLRIANPSISTGLEVGRSQTFGRETFNAVNLAAPQHRIRVLYQGELTKKATQYRRT